MVSSSLLSEDRGGEAAVEAVATPTAAKSVTDSPILQSAKTAMNSASQSGAQMMSALRRKSWSGKLAMDKSQIQFKSALTKLPKSLWKAQSPAADDKKALEDAAKFESCLEDDEDISPPPSEISTSTAVVETDSFDSFFSEWDMDDHCEGTFPSCEEEIMCHDWEAVLRGRPISDLTPTELRHLVRNGVPATYRQDLWRHWFSVPEVGDVEVLQHSVPADVAHQIDLDVPRTRSKCMGEPEQLMLRRVLRAYAAHDPTVGYCQGMNDIAAVFVLSGFQESQVLHGLCSVSKSCCPDYFCSSLKGYVRDVAVLGVLVRELLPSETVELLDGLDVPLNMLAADHFLALASHTWPLEAVVRLWDLFLSEGPPAVFASFLALLQLYLPKGAEEHRIGTAMNPIDAPERVEEFRKAVSRGVTEDLNTILEKTCELIPSIPMSRVENLRYVFSVDYKRQPVENK